MENFKSPSKTKLKRKCRISNNHFKILTAPSHPIPAPETVLERVAEWPKTIATYLVRNGMGTVAAVVFVPFAFHEVNKGIEAYRDAASKAHEWYSPFSNLPSQQRGQPVPFAHYVAVGTTSSSNVVMTTFSTGTGSLTLPV